MKSDFLNTIREEVEASFEPGEVEAFPSFEAFWNEIEVQNAYEWDEWASWKAAGIKFFYEKVYNEKKGASE